MAKICNKCGSANEDAMRFCINCGSAFAQAQVQMPEQPKIKRPIYEQTDYAAIDARNAAKQQPVQQVQPPVTQNPMQAQPPVQQRPQPVQPQMQYGQQGYAPAQQSAPPKAPKKKNLTPIIVSIVAAVVVIGVALGVIFGIVLPNKEKGKEDEKEQGATVATAIDIQPTAKTIAAGMYNVFAVKKDGTVVATGDNSHGACNVGEWTDIVAVSSGGDYTLGLKSDGTVVATEYIEAEEDDEYGGECDVGDWTDIVSVVAAGDHSVGLKSDGTVVAVGKNLAGRCDVQDWSDIVAISASARNTVGLKSDGTVVATGDNVNGECEVEKWKDIIAISSCVGITAGLKSDGTVVATGDNRHGACNVDGWNDIVAIATAYDIIYGLKKDGTILSTKDGAADNDSDFIKISYMLGEIEKWKDIVAISTYGLGTEVIGLKADGTVVAVTITDYWREEYDDDLGFVFDVSGWKDVQTTVPERFKTEVGKEFVGSEEPSKPVTTPDDGKNTYLQNDIYISAGASHAVALKSDGTVIATKYIDDPTYSIDDYVGQCDVDEWKDIVAVSAAKYCTVGLKSDGTVVAVGSNEWGQCDINGWSNVAAVAAGGDHTVGLKSDGTVVAVGSDSDGACDVEDWTGIVAIAAGSYHTVGLKYDGTVVATGNNSYGACDVEDWSDIIAVSAGYHYTVGLKSDGTVVAVGLNDYGVCDVDNWKEIVAVSAGFDHNIGLKSDGTVVAAGGKGYGQCDVENFKNIIAVSAGTFCTVGLKSDGTVVAVGNNDNGQCEVHGWTNIKTPTQNVGGNKLPSKPSGTVDITVPITEAQTEKTTQPVKPPVSTGWKAAYNSYLKKLNNNKDEYDLNSDASFDLVYITDDDVPELLVSQGTYNAAKATVLTFADGEIVEIGEFGYMGEISYVERGDILIDSRSSRGNSSGTVYRIGKNGSTEKVISYFSNAASGNELRYEINEETVSEEEFDARMSELYPENAVWTDVFSQPTLTSENIDKYCK